MDIYKWKKDNCRERVKERDLMSSPSLSATSPYLHPLSPSHFLSIMSPISSLLLSSPLLSYPFISPIVWFAALIPQRECPLIFNERVQNLQENEGKQQNIKKV
jgi:hypothetical protein